MAEPRKRKMHFDSHTADLQNILHTHRMSQIDVFEHIEVNSLVNCYDTV